MICQSITPFCMKLNFLFTSIIVFVLTSKFILQAREHTWGVGIYPGDVREDFSSVVRIDKTTYRNLALFRPAYHSIGYIYNLTAQLTTNAIREATLPGWISTSSSQQGVLKKNERQWILYRLTGVLPSSTLFLDVGAVQSA